MTQKERLIKIREHHKLSQEEFGKRIGVSRFSISNYESGKRNLTDRVVRDICREFNINYEWLTEGEGEMLSDIDDDLGVILDQLLVHESDFAKRIFRAFLKMDQSDWEALERVVNIIKKEPAQN